MIFFFNKIKFHRFICLVLGYSLVFLETYLIIYGINYLTHNENRYTYYFILLSFSFGIAFFYRQGYKYLFMECHFPQLKSVKEHSLILMELLTDVFAGLMTIVNIKTLNYF